ncbi:YdeI/OmpD-associated family protein [Longitalea luteola]|uniref:YdeI/OmpD-associated family protein n=1 Tax=Longitalea luteola TaxID=2812563 RepID=UPI001F623B6B|nr:YdeI/OmpD-associated family protein [Longitalea luteola]
MMVTFTTTLLQFEQQGEKTGWTYIEIPADLAQKLKPGNKKTFRVKGKLDNFAIKAAAVMPMGGGNFILPINATMRKGIGKRKGAMVKVQLQEDKAEVPINAELLECLQDDPDAQAHFNKLSKSHQLYFSKWIDSAKTEATRTNRLARTLIALGKGWDYGQMLRAGKQDKEGL